MEKITPDFVIVQQRERIKSMNETKFQNIPLGFFRFLFVVNSVR